MNTDLYENFAERYDLSRDQFEPHDPQVIQFFRRIFTEHGTNTVLDCACGTGRHLLLFRNLGREVWGSDLSKAMLAQARRNLAHYRVEVPLILTDYRDLPHHFQNRFDMVACLGSIGYMHEEREILRAFRSMFAVLREGGILVLSVITTDKQWMEKPRFKLVINTPDVSRLFVMDYFERTVRYHVLDIFHSEEVNQLKWWGTELTVLLMDEQDRLLKKAGFRMVEFYGGFDFSPYDEGSSDHLIAVIHK